LTQRGVKHEETKPSCKKIHSAPTPDIGLFVILPFEGYLYILDLVQECFKIVLRRLKESKRTLLAKKQDDKCGGEKEETRTCQKWREVAVSKQVAAFSFKLLCFLKAPLHFQRPFLSSRCEVRCSAMTESCRITARSTHTREAPLQKLQ